MLYIVFENPPPRTDFLELDIYTGMYHTAVPALKMAADEDMMSWRSFRYHVLCVGALTSVEIWNSRIGPWGGGCLVLEGGIIATVYFIYRSNPRASANFLERTHGYHESGRATTVPYHTLHNTTRRVFPGLLWPLALIWW